MKKIPDSGADLTQCDREPVHIPGAIQDFGVLLAVDPYTLQIAYVSSNAETVFGVPAEQCLDLPISELLKRNFTRAELEKTAEFSTESFNAQIFLHQDMILIEAEKKEDSKTWQNIRLEKLSLDLLQATEDLQGLLKVAAKSVLELSQLDRVMIYRFHPDLHGEVVAESLRPGTESFLGLHYPASDIPQPARAVFLQNWVRMIPDVHASPIPLLTHRSAPLDLGKSLLRAVSPVHLEYLQNMGVAASLTLPLIHDGKLWGLIAGHAMKARYQPLRVRDACEAIARMTSSLIESKVELEIRLKRERLDQVQVDLMDRMSKGQNLAQEITEFVPNLMHLIPAQGTASALYVEGDWVTSGNVPQPYELDRLVNWLIANHGEKVVFSTPALAEVFPEAASYRELACGVLALSIPKSPFHYIFWFRPEKISTVHWAGKPEKLQDNKGRLHPRLSFAAWEEEVRGQSEPWTPFEINAAMSLRNDITALDLKRQFQKEQEARLDAERAMQSREELMAVLSHDLKNPINSIQLSAKIAEKFLASDSKPRVLELLKRVQKATANMNNLINDILSITQLESGYLTVERTPETIDDVISEGVELVEPLAVEKDIKLEYRDQAPTLVLDIDRGRILQVLSNLLGNAIKFTPNYGSIQISTQLFSPEFLEVCVKDSGTGIAVENLPYVFDRFWQAKETKRLGTGLGLAIAQGIVRGHGGNIWAESDGKTWTAFRFTLPISKAINRAEN